jgi:hypothetical protein
VPKILQCDRCNYNAQSPYLVCAVHPSGVDGDYCPDFESSELWEPENPDNYKDQHIEDMFWHPIFTGRCPMCNFEFSRFQPPPVNWYCENCDWEDE